MNQVTITTNKLRVRAVYIHCVIFFLVQVLDYGAFTQINPINV